MRRFLSFLFFTVLALSSFSQTPQAFKYQGVARDLEGNPISYQEILLRVSVLSGSAQGDPIFVELHQVTTSNVGLFTIDIGNMGMVISGNFSEIDWGASTYFLKVEIDMDGGLNFQLMGTSQLMSVPYALYAERTAHPEDEDADTTNEIQTLTKSGNEVTLSKNGGSFIDDNTTYLPGTGLTLDSNTFNSAWTEANGNIYNNNPGNIGLGTSTPDQSAILELKTSTKGFLPPRLTTSEILAIPNPVEGLTVYNTTLKKLSVFNGSNWDCDNVNLNACNGIEEFEYGGQTYNTVVIGNQCWMKENLNIGEQITGAHSQTDNSVVEKYCYNNLESNCDVYGGLYQWNEMMQYSIIPGSRGICPNGWHLPTDNEWYIIASFLGGEAMAGGKLKETDTLHWHSPNLRATNSSRFTAIPGGYSGSYNYYISLGRQCMFWTSDKGNNTQKYLYILAYDQAGFYQGADEAYLGLSVRCILNDPFVPNLQPTVPSNPTPTNGSVNQPILSIPSWICSDPENDLLTYDVYFGTTNPPAIVSLGLSEQSYNCGQLNFSTTYFWKVIAHDNQNNSSESPVWSFTTESQPWQCGNPITDDRDGKTYNTVQIGDQCWMAQNLNIGTMINVGNDQDNNGTIEKYCYYNTEGICTIYGGLYQWNEMMGYSTTQGIQGICPQGWHLPGLSDWGLLTDFLGGEGVAGGKMKETGFLHWSPPNSEATNNSGFTGLPGGIWDPGVSFYDLSKKGAWWSSTKEGYYYNYRYLSNDSPYITSNSGTRYTSLSVRCIKDN